MSPISIFLLLPIACIVALPPQYAYYAKDSEQSELPKEFWSQHFGPDFQHALHFQLGQTQVIENENGIEKNVSESTSSNKKRSTYIVHNSQMNDQSMQEAMGNSMKVHLLQPDEMEALEREMLSYARGSGMMQLPVVVNLPQTEGSMAKNPGQDKPVVLNLPPVVYHSDLNGANQRYSSHSPFLKHDFSQSPSFYDQLQIPFQRMSPYGEMQFPYDFEKPQEVAASPSDKESDTRQKFNEPAPQPEEESKQEDDRETQDSDKPESKE